MIWSVASAVTIAPIIDKSERQMTLGVGSVTVVFCDVSGNTLVLCVSSSSCCCD